VNTYIPPFNITGTIIQQSEAIAFELGRLSGEKMIAPKLSLRKSNQIKTIQASLAIEGNTLSLDQVTALLEGKCVLGPAKDILEIKNAGDLYANIARINPLDISDLLKAHGVLMNNLISESGCFRSGNVGIFNGSKVSHVAPSAKRVYALIEDLFDYIRSTTDYSWLIKSCVFHYEFEFIHPFEDGNGRIGRLWQQLLLMKYHPLFESVPIEVLIKEQQQDYYSALSQSDRMGDSTAFIEFMLTIIHQALKEYGQDIGRSPKDAESRLSYAKEFIKNESFSRKEYMNIHRDISHATASRDLLFGVEHKILLKMGNRNQTLYGFVKKEEKMSRLYDMDPAIIKNIADELKEASPTNDWIKRFIEDAKIKKAIDINDDFYKKNYKDLSHILPDIKEEEHHQMHEAIAEIVIARCIHKSSFEAKHEFCTGEGKNSKDTVDFKVLGREDTYFIEIRSTRESDNSKEINKLFILNDFSDEAIQETINHQNICVDEDPYQNTRRLQLQILEKCTKNEKGKLYTHKFPTKDETKAKHIIVCAPFGREYFDEYDLVDVLYRDYSDSRENEVNARGIFHKDRTDLESKILQERIDCVVFINYINDKLEVYIGYNPVYFCEKDSMKEFETMLAQFFGADNVKRI
jgi:Fic family protein